MSGTAILSGGRRTVVENVVQGVAQIEFSVFGVVGDLHFEMLAEVEVEAFDDQYFEHRGQGFLLLIFRFYRMHSIYYNREPNSPPQNKTLPPTYTSPTTYTSTPTLAAEVFAPLMKNLPY